MALRLKSNPAPRSGALFVSNPRKRKSVRKNRAVKKLRVVRKRKNTAKKRVVRKNRKNPVRAKKLRIVRKRKNTAKKRVVRKNRKNPVRKRKNVAKKRIVRKNRKNPVRKRKNVMRKRRVVRKARMNPRRKTRIIRKNPMTLSFLKPVEKLVSKVPVIGKKVAPYTQPALVAMVGGVGVVGGMNMVGRIPVVGQYAKYPFGHAFGATVMGLGLAVVSAFLPVKPATKKALALSFAGAGGAINAGQLMMCGFDLQACKDQNLAMLGADADVDVLDVDPVAGVHLGDGMYYEVQPFAGVAHDMAGIDYDNAQYGDANACPADFSPIEGEMAMRGRDAFMAKFGTAPKRMAGQKRYMSLMAGKQGHRWGWLIKSLGWQRFSQLAQLPPAQRRKLIAKLKASAIQASQATFDRELTGGLQGIAMSGIAMDTAGLAVDNMAGIAIAGAGI
jgi:hypothetical protein